MPAICSHAIKRVCNRARPGAGGLFSSAQLLERMKVAATRSGAIGKKEGDAEGVIAAAPKRLEAVYGLPVSCACDDGTDELHGTCPIASPIQSRQQVS